MAVIEEIGHEKIRYLNGRAAAVNSAGDTKWITLYDIYTIAKDLGDHVTKN
ncbi:MAG: hypothetical protein JXA20_17540 [Spirochaetes bacterium]|nr:hypothetical protein [Spirochaetota bacterium]